MRAKTVDLGLVLVREMAKAWNGWEDSKLLDVLSPWGRRRPGQSRSELAGATGLSPSNVRRALSRLHRKGLVTYKAAKGKRHYWRRLN